MIKADSGVSMSDVILINPPIFYEDRTPNVLDVSFPPLGLLYIASVLEKNNISVRILDVGVRKLSIEKTIKIIRNENPCVIGISSMTAMLQGAVEIATEIKKKFGDIILICLGGSHISADPGFIDRFPCFDFGVTGEGEITFTKIVKRGLQGEQVKGIYHGEIVQNLDDLPFPARHLIDRNNYKKEAAIIATRGCPYNCYFCSRPAVSRRVRYRSPENIVDEMETIYDECGGYFQFQDDTFTINREDTIELCNEMISRKLNAKWTANTRIDLVDEVLLKKMHDAGCYTLVFGIESGNERIRNDIINKKFSNEEISTVLQLCKKNRIDADGYFILGHPTETIKEINDTINLILNSNFNIIGLSIATPFPGSRLYDIAAERGIIGTNFGDRFAKGELGKGYGGVYPVYFPESLTPLELERIREATYRKFYFRLKYMTKRLIKDFRSLSSLRRDLSEGIPLLLHGSTKRTPYHKIGNKKG